MLEIDILRNSSQKKLDVLRDAFYGFGCPKRPCSTTLLKRFEILIDLSMFEQKWDTFECGL